MTNSLKLLIAIIIALTTCACDDKNEPNATDSIVGSWYGTRTYYNPVGGTKYQYLSMSFESNGTGTLEYESPTSYSVAKFVYEVNGNKITCRGAYANTHGDVESDFTMTLSIEGDRLIPINKYQQFILTRDGSIMTDGNGNEIIDQSNLLHRIWISTSGETIAIFQESTYIEYVLSTPFSKTYTSRHEGGYSYDASRKIIYINGTQFDILSLTSTYLSLKSQNSGDIFNYNIGTDSDIPVSEDELYTGTANGYDWVDLGLPSQTKWATMNIGAKNEIEPGDYFAWGEIAPKKVYTEESYKFYRNGVYSVYLEPDAPEDADGLKILRDEDNAARVLWGPSWDMPTYAQLEELDKYCTITNNGTYSILIGPNGRTIKFPKGGYKYDNNQIWNNGIAGHILSKELKYKGKSGGWPKCWFPTTIGNRDTGIYLSHYYRHCGYNIRPVLKK